MINRLKQTSFLCIYCGAVRCNDCRASCIARACMIALLVGLVGVLPVTTGCRSAVNLDEDADACVDAIANVETVVEEASADRASTEPTRTDGISDSDQGAGTSEAVSATTTVVDATPERVETGADANEAGGGGGGGGTKLDEDPPPRELLESLSNKILDVQILESVNDGTFLFLSVATDIYATRESSIEAENLRPECPVPAKCVAIRRDGTTPAESIEEELTRQAAVAAKLGPFRAKLTIVQDACVEFLLEGICIIRHPITHECLIGTPDSTAICPLATDVTISSRRP